MPRANAAQAPTRCPKCSATPIPEVWWCPQCYTDLRPAKPRRHGRHARTGPADVAVRPDGRVTTDSDEAAKTAETMIEQLAAEHLSNADPATQLGQRFANRRSRVLLGMAAAIVLTVTLLVIFTVIGSLL